MVVELSNPPTTPVADTSHRLDDLAQIIQAYNQVTLKLQSSHEALRRQVGRLQTELASTDAQLQRSKRLAALGEMAAGIAHEIRNPLAAIQLYAGVLVNDLSAGSDPRQCVTIARQLAQAVRGLNAVVTDVLAFARELKPRLQPVTAADLFDRVTSAHRPAIEAAGVVVERPHHDQRITFDADPDLLHQALLNLIRNAVEAMEVRSHPSPPGQGREATGVAKILSLSARREDGRVTLTVADTGPGIADEVIDRIFNPFFTTRSTGTGLGLAIVHRIVDAHRGVIAVRNRIDETGAPAGAEFELSFPADGGTR